MAPHTCTSTVTIELGEMWRDVPAELSVGLRVSCDFKFPQHADPNLSHCRHNRTFVYLRHIHAWLCSNIRCTLSSDVCLHTYALLCKSKHAYVESSYARSGRSGLASQQLQQGLTGRSMLIAHTAQHCYYHCLLFYSLFACMLPDCVNCGPFSGSLNKCQWLSTHDQYR